MRRIPISRSQNALLLAASFLTYAFVSAAQDRSGRPNVLLIMTDDQGYGDLGAHGNPVLRTPNLDRFAAESVGLTRFYVSPVCAPTRASLMTGRYNYRTGVVDTYLGRAMMRPEEVTLAETLGEAGYRTGIFGKWHLGDNYPMRPIDQGFDEALVHKGGGIRQPSDPPGGSSYFDPYLYKNGREIRASGYCSDVFTDAAIRFVTENRDRPFFAYLSFNAPHTPLEVADRDADPYRRMNLTADTIPSPGRPIEGRFDAETTARVYGMIANIDENLGRLFAKLDELALAENTIVIFMTDNGPQQPRYNAGLRSRKGWVWEGGIRVPFYIRWPGRLQAGKRLAGPAAHIDVAPTLLEACGVAAPGGVQIDGVSLWPMIAGDADPWPERTLYFQWHRGDEPELHRAFAAVGPRFKLVQAVGRGEQSLPENPRFELYDIVNDPYEMNDLAQSRPALVERMRSGYESWLADVGRPLGYSPPPIHLGSPQENPVMLTRQDWRGPRASWGREGLGHWFVRVARPGRYEARLIFEAATGDGIARLELGAAVAEQPFQSGASTVTLPEIDLAQGEAQLNAWIEVDGSRNGVRYVEVTRRD